LFVEYPTAAAIGENFETIVLAPTIDDANFIVDNHNIYVYIKPNIPDSKWQEWTKTTSLYLESASSKKYSVRYNQNERYEIKFGNNISSKENSLNLPEVESLKKLQKNYLILYKNFLEADPFSLPF